MNTLKITVSTLIVLIASVFFVGCPFIGGGGGTETVEPVLVLTPNSISGLEVGESRTVQVTAKDDQGDAEGFNVASNDPSIASAAPTGFGSFEVTGVNRGSTTITVTSVNSVIQVNMPVSVVAAGSSGDPTIYFDPGTISLEAGSSGTVSVVALDADGNPDNVAASNVYSENTNIATATLGTDGQTVTVVAVAEGATRVRAESDSGAVEYLPVDVYASGGIATGIKIETHGQGVEVSETISVAGFYVGNPDSVTISLGGQDFSSALVLDDPDPGDWNATIDTTTVGDGSKSLTATATYSDGTSKQDEVSVVVNNSTGTLLRVNGEVRLGSSSNLGNDELVWVDVVATELNVSDTEPDLVRSFEVLGSEFPIAYDLSGFGNGKEYRFEAWVDRDWDGSINHNDLYVSRNFTMGSSDQTENLVVELMQGMVSANPASVEVVQSDTATITVEALDVFSGAEGFYAESQNMGVATVISETATDFVVEAVAPGTATILITGDSGASAEVTVTVPDLSDLVVSTDSILVGQESTETIQVTATNTAGDPGSFTVTALNPGIADVSETTATGFTIATGTTPGTAVFEVEETTSGLIRTVEVQVPDYPFLWVDLESAETFELREPYYWPVAVVLLDASGNDAGFTVTTDVSNIIAITDVKPVGFEFELLSAGTVNVTVTADFDSSLSYSSTITVEEPATVQPIDVQ